MENTTQDYRDQPTYWFAILDIACERGNFDRAEEAQRQLKRLGVKVSFASLRTQRTASPLASRGTIQ